MWSLGYTKYTLDRSNSHLYASEASFKWKWALALRHLIFRANSRRICIDRETVLRNLKPLVSHGCYWLFIENSWKFHSKARTAMRPPLVRNNDIIGFPVFVSNWSHCLMVSWHNWNPTALLSISVPMLNLHLWAQPFTQPMGEATAPNASNLGHPLVPVQWAVAETQGTSETGLM